MASTSTKVWLFLVLNCVVFLALGYHWAGRWGLFLGLMATLALNFFMIFRGEAQLLHGVPAEPWRGRDPWGLNEMIRTHCQRLRLKVPRLFVFNHNSVTAFSVSFPWGRSAIAVSTGLLKKLSPEEIEAVVVHQICHLRRLEGFLFGFVSLLANALVSFGDFLDRFWIPNYFFDRKQQPFRHFFSPFGWLMIKSVVTPRVYFENDQLAAELLQDPRRLAEVLWRLEGLAETCPRTVPACTSHLFIVNPEGLLQKNLFLKSHPPTSERIKRLIGYYPI